jgi:hypothetical protein
MRWVEDSQVPSEAALRFGLFNETWKPAGDITKGALPPMQTCDPLSV